MSANIPQILQNTMIRISIAWLLGLFGLGIAETATAREAVRIMPLGDSITQGNRHQNSYRRPLWHMLLAAGHEVDFVGSQRRNHWGRPPDPDFDLDHEGHWGWQVDQVLARLDGWAEAVRPDIVLVHLGTNDLSRGKSPGQIVKELILLVDILRGHNPRVTVLMAQLIDNAHLSPQVQALNAAIAGIESHGTLRSPVIIVDQWSGFNPNIHTYDGTHPNVAGEEKIAERWFASLTELLRARGR